MYIQVVFRRIREPSSFVLPYQPTQALPPIQIEAHYTH